ASNAMPSDTSKTRNGGSEINSPNNIPATYKHVTHKSGRFISAGQAQHWSTVVLRVCYANVTLADNTPVMQLKLGVNIDHVATLREARYRGREQGEPDPVAAALACEDAGAHGITAHLREDRRHIQDRDIWRLRESIRTRLNLEMGNAAEIINIALKLKP